LSDNCSSLVVSNDGKDRVARPETYLDFARRFAFVPGAYHLWLKDMTPLTSPGPQRHLQRTVVIHKETYMLCRTPRNVQYVGVCARDCTRMQGRAGKGGILATWKSLSKYSSGSLCL